MHTVKSQFAGLKVKSASSDLPVWIAKTQHASGENPLLHRAAKKDSWCFIKTSARSQIISYIVSLETEISWYSL